MGAVSLNEKYITISERVSFDKPVREITQPITFETIPKKSPTALNALDKSGKTDKIKLSIGVKIKVTKLTISLIIPVKIALITGPSPQSHHDRDF